MFTVAYLYRIDERVVDDFLRIQRDAAAIYVEHGALEDETLVGVDLAAQYGCQGFGDAIGAAAGQRVFIGLARFRDRTHHDEVMERVDADPRIDALFAEVGDVVSIAEIARGEFDRIVSGRSA